MQRELPSYGGQALIEGVMMRGTQVCSIAVRAPDQSIVIETRRLGGLYRSRLMRLPFLRGLLMLYDALVLGIRALTFSANIQVPEEEKIEGRTLALTLGFSFLIGLVVFMFLPVGVGLLAERFLAWEPWQSNILEGLVRLGLFLAYLRAVRSMSDIQRVYGYHGAEHKTINAFEAGADLQLETIRSFPRVHPRCGTAFLLTVFVFSILLFSALGPLPIAPRIISRLFLLPLLAALAYEYIRFTARHSRSRWARIMMMPNLWLQRLTTAEPDDEMLAVAMAAFESMRSQEENEFARASSSAS
ncbi:MAG: DUF1385 domain-containing protein [Anaerolineales bacterium]|nr:DUF1385 domain-containing protein [Anaerolineales bacterium]